VENMSRQERSMRVYDGKVFGKKVSRYGLENGYLDYMTLSFIVGDCILNNDIFEYAGYGNWDLYSGEMEDEDGDYYEVYQYYMITESGARFLEEYTDEIVYYHPDLNMYLWGITHFGTSWDYVLTDIELN
jgi:hypothetical protein